MMLPVRVVARFVVSSFCHTGGCVAIAPLSDGGIAVRDSKTVDGPQLRFDAEEWKAFVAGVKAGEFDIA